MEQLELSLEYRLRWFDFDCFNHIKASCVFDIFQDVATVQAEDMGIGYSVVKEKDLFWALVRMKYEILQEPKFGQRIFARTWPHSPSTYSFLRDYTMCDSEGNTLIVASSEWVPMNVKTRSFTRVDEIYKGANCFLPNRAFEKKPRKILWPQAAEIYNSYTFTPHFSDTDANGHVNNSRYPSFVMDGLNPGSDKHVRTLQMDFRHEVLPESLLHIDYCSYKDVSFAQGKRDDGEIAFNCCIEWDVS